MKSNIQNNIQNTLIEVAKLGRSVGLHGAMKCHILTDFPEIFQTNTTFFASSMSSFHKNTTSLTLKSFDSKKQLIVFHEITTPESAKTLTNCILSCSIEDTKKYCHLNKDEFFWFDIIGCMVLENNEKLGKVTDIQRITNTDFLIIQTDEKLCKQYARTFLIPYINQFILTTDITNKTIQTQNAKAILEES